MDENIGTSPTATYYCEIDSVSIREVISRRVWWKPWTWLRRKIYLEYNPPLHSAGWDRGREIEPPHYAMKDNDAE